MLILAICTAAAPYSIALFRNETLLAMHMGEWPGEYLMPHIQSLCREQKLTFNDINVFAAVHGPGAFAGLRTGLTTAKTMAQSLKKCLVTVDALEATAIQFEPSSVPILVVQKACRSEHNVGLFGVNPLQRLIPNTVASAQQIISMLLETEGELVLAGDGSAMVYPAVRKQNKNSKVRISSGVTGLLSASGVGILAYRLARQKHFADPLKAKPLYSHAPNIKLSAKIDYEKLRTASR